MNKIRKYGLIIIKNKRLLVNRKFNTKLFLMPGGKPIDHETIEECLSRELKEEHNVKITNIEFFNEYEDIAANEENTMLFMRLYIGDINNEVTVNREIEEFKWIGKEDDTSLLSPIIKNKIFPDLIEKKML